MEMGILFFLFSLVFVKKYEYYEYPFFLTKAVRRVYAINIYVSRLCICFHDNKSFIVILTAFILFILPFAYNSNEKLKLYSHVDFKDTRLHNQDLKCHSSQKKIIKVTETNFIKLFYEKKNNNLI